jgi:hypothetical protein
VAWEAVRWLGELWSVGWGAARSAAARPEHGGQTIVTFLCDTGERYVSSELFQNVRDTV